MRKVSSYKCPECGMRFKSLSAWGDHLDRIHGGTIPKGYSYARYFYYCTTGKTAGSCVQCHKPTEWNETTGKYSRYCSDPKCKQAYVKTAKKRMVDKYGKSHLLNDPKKQREMLDARSSVYKFRDGGTVKFLSSYERDFLMTAEFTLGLKSKDIIGPSPNTYVYMYEGKEHFYIPDFFIPDLNLEIEIKDGGDDPNNHPHMQVDRAKEKLKDEMMIKNPSVNYFKVIDKKYDDFYKFLLDCKLAIDDDVKAKLVEQLAAIESAVYTGLDTPEEVYAYMRKNIKYAEFTKYKSIEDTLKSHRGSCHDQAAVAYMFLKSVGVKPKLNFFIAYRDGDDVGGDTHTFITYEYGNSIIWFETAWSGAEGIRKYPDMTALKKDITTRHLKTSNGQKYPKLEFTSVSLNKLEVGMNLGEYVNACLGESANESALTASERTNFGLPDLKKYPMPDEKHVLLAIQYFNHVDEDREKELADNIIKRMKELKIAHVNVGEKNRFSKYYKPSEDSVMTDWCASEPGMGLVAMESGRGDAFYTPIRLSSNQWCTYKGKRYYPLYIVLLRDISPLGSVIRAYTKEEFSHSSISFDASMQDCYTFGNKLLKEGKIVKKSFGTAHESFNGNSGRFSYPKNTVYHIYVMFFDERQIKAVRKTVDNIFTHHNDYQYNIEGLFSYIFNKPKTDPNKLFCSQFVSLVINSGKPGILTKDPSLYTPVGLTALRGVFDVEEGTIGTYDKTVVEKRTKRIFEKIVENENFAALEHTNLLYNADWEDSDSINISGGFYFPEE